MTTTNIPAFFTSGPTKAKGKGDVFIDSRSPAGTVSFSIDINIHFDIAADDYPAGSLTIVSNMTDGIHGTFTASSIESVNAFGLDNPTVFLTGRCNSNTFTRAPQHGCRYWVMIANNSKDGRGTPDIVGFCIQDRKGNRMAYGTGPLKGNIDVLQESTE